MKVCLINNLYKPYNRGGAEAYVEKLFKGFLERGDNPFIISTVPHNQGFQKEKRTYYLPSLYYDLVKLPKVFRFFWHLFSMFNFVNYIKISKILNKEKPDIVITNNLIGVGFLLPALIKKKRIRHIHVLHDIQLLHPNGLMYLGDEKIIDGFFANIYQNINKILFSSVNLVVAPSQWIIDLHRRKKFFLGAEAKRIFNPIDIISFDNKKLNKKIKDFIYVGQIEKHKGVIELLKIADIITKKNDDIFFKFVGDGSKLGVLKSRFDSDKITFMGRLSGRNLCEEIFKSDCLLAPSLCYENSPTVIYEAGSLGVPFIYSSLGGASEIGNYLGGYDFDPRDSRSLKDAIFKFIIRGEGSENNKKVLGLSTEKYIENLLSFF